MCVIVQGLCRIHAAGMVHLDIKPENVLVSDDWKFKIGDLGLTCVIGSDITVRISGSTAASHVTRGPAEAQDVEGDNRYMASELLEGSPTQAADIFSLGGQRT
jgi:mitosis inhibitor protein kinase SWE1